MRLPVLSNPAYLAVKTQTMKPPPAVAYRNASIIITQHHLPNPNPNQDFQSQSPSQSTSQSQFKEKEVIGREGIARSLARSLSRARALSRSVSRSFELSHVKPVNRRTSLKCGEKTKAREGKPEIKKSELGEDKPGCAHETSQKSVMRVLTFVRPSPSSSLHILLLLLLRRLLLRGFIRPRRLVLRRGCLRFRRAEEPHEINLRLQCQHGPGGGLGQRIVAGTGTN